MEFNKKPKTNLHIYLDESGDLGFGKGGSKYFTIAYIITKKPVELNRIVRKIKQKYKIPKNVELKACTTRERIKIDLLNRLSKLDIEIQSITVKKKNVVNRLRTDTNILYNYMVGLSLVDEKLAYLDPQIKKVIIIFDRRITSIKRGFDIDGYLKYEVWVVKKREDIDLEIHHLESHRVYGLEAIDNIVNPIFKKYNSSNCELYNIIKNRISSDKTLFFK